MNKKPKQGKLLTNGFAIPTIGGVDCVVEELLGKGGQGEVYKVNIGGQHLALKWYNERTRTQALKTSLEELIEMGSPSDKFLWPIQVIECQGQFGYTMGIIPAGYESAQKVQSPTVKLTYKMAAKVCLQLVDSFRKIHAKGLCYQDVNFGNLFINFQTGDILICDNENIAPHGRSITGVIGFQGFMAPEIVRGEHMPDTQTDLFSLAVLMFHLLFIEHPLDGARYANSIMDPEMVRKCYGSDPLFVFDPNDDSNRPIKGTQENAHIFWNLYPQFVKDAFTQVFTMGLNDRNKGRPLLQDWIDVFRKLQENIFPCPHCGCDVVYDTHIFKQTQQISCWRSSCTGFGQKLQVPPRLRIKVGNRERVIVLNTDTKLFQYQMAREPDFEKGGKIVGEVVRNPKDPTKWGIRNKTAETWQFVSKSGETKDVSPEKALPLSASVKNIDFKTATAEIRI
ncbi:MAG: serine/threonine protein kinase [Firmicutes bacterium]|nr:serine/threonine protein kinase [Bacillota bacterium]